VEYLRETGLAGYLATPGNLGAYTLRRDEGARTEFLMLTFWESLDSVRGFAGDDIATAVFYAEDDQFLVEREDFALHYEVEGGSTSTP
jgi:heme-degrading monooxygenase HmoA